MKWIVSVLLAGLVVAWPFCTRNALGTSEAFNYSLAVADAVTQARAGEWPALVGQTEFAFNGRIHPLRTAPYLTLAACGLDLLTFRTLGFWTLQNLTVGLSLLAGALTCYGSLRRATPAEPGTAAFLAAAYVLSPGVLAPAYTMDLYMTVQTVPLIPLVLAANLVAFERRAFAVLAGLAAALAACWLAHPPVALWLCAASGLVQLAGLVAQRPTWRDLPRLGGAALLFLALSAFGVASALTVSPYGNITHVHDTSSLLREVGRTFPGALRPVSANAGALTDFQLGYFYWGAAVLATGFALWRRQGRALVLLAIAGLFLVLTLPVPGATAWLWDHLPTLALSLTNQWPMQRLYLPVTALVLFALALVWRPLDLGRPGLRDAARALLFVGIAWTCWQSWHYLSRGLASHRTPGETARRHLGSNLELTLISYAILGTPKDFSHGAMDPGFQFQLATRSGYRPLASNWTIPLPPHSENHQGTLVATAGGAPDVLELSRQFVLQPGARYRLTLRFLAPAGEALLELRGTGFFRQYLLPESGGPQAFGMQPGNVPVLSLWTSQDQPETVSLRLIGPGLAGGPWRGRPFAEYAFERVDPSALPVRLESLLPLRARVRSPEPAYLITPRMAVAGYSATVNGAPALVQVSPDDRVMVPVPAGESEVVVRYPGPGLVRRAFSLSLFAWAGVGVWGLLAWGPARVRERVARPFLSAGRQVGAALRRIPRRTWLAATAAGVLLAVAGWGALKWSAHRQAAGPVSLRLVLARGKTGRQEPLVVTGQTGAGAFFYVVYADKATIRLGIDVWGRFGWVSDPIPVDYFTEHDIVVEAGSLYPPGHPAVSRLAPDELARLRRQVRLTFDGQVVFDQTLDTYDSQIEQVTVGRNLLGGSSCEADFTGRLVRVERQPPAR